MRLYEITSPITPEKFIIQRGEDPLELRKYSKDAEVIGSGAFADAFSTKTEPGTIRKVVGPVPRSGLERDAYFKYVQLLSKNDRFVKNPYFPKIYDIQIKAVKGNYDDELKYIYAVDMERLHQWDDLSNKEALILGKKMFYNYLSLVKPKGWEKQALLNFIKGHAFDVYGAKVQTIFKDPYLKQAVMLLKNMHRLKLISFFDIHGGNIMFRRTSFGPQLVFTDPVI